MKPFIIYLDIDGVLVSYTDLKNYHEDGKHAFVPKSVEILNQIISMFDADLCIVSTWARGYYDRPGDMKNFLISRGIDVRELTIGDIDHRAEFVIKQKELGYKRFLVIDDEFLEYYKRVDEIGFNRILPSNSWRCLDEFDLIGVTRNFKRINDENWPK